jgi:hypothetical protein
MLLILPAIWIGFKAKTTKVSMHICKILLPYSHAFMALALKSLHCCYVIIPRYFVSIHCYFTVLKKLGMLFNTIFKQHSSGFKWDIGIEWSTEKCVEGSCDWRWSLLFETEHEGTKEPAGTPFRIAKPRVFDPVTSWIWGKNIKLSSTTSVEINKLSSWLDFEVRD